MLTTHENKDLNVFNSLKTKIPQRIALTVSKYMFRSIHRGSKYKRFIKLKSSFLVESSKVWPMLLFNYYIFAA